MNKQKMAPFWTAIFALTICAGGVALAEPGGVGLPLAQQADAIDRPVVGERLDLTEVVPLPSGELRLAPGTPVYRLRAGDEPCGLFIAGPATLIHRVTDVYSVPLARRNLDMASKYETREIEGGIEFREPVQDVLIWSFDLSLGEVVSESEPSPPLPEWWTKVLNRGWVTPPSINLLSHRGLAAKGALSLWAKGRNGILRLRRDAAVYATEHLFEVEKDTVSIHPVYKGRYYSTFLTSAPVGRQWWGRFPAATVATAHQLDVEQSGKRSLLIKTKSTVQATTSNVGIYAVDLASRTVDDRKEWPATIRKLKIDGQPADYLHRHGRLLVALPRIFSAGESFRISVEMAADWAHQRDGDNAWALGTWAWYPQPPMNGELATVEIRVSTPKPFVPFASGTVVERREVGDLATLTTKISKPVQFPVVTAGKYEIFEETRDDLTVYVATYGGGKKKAAKRVANNFFASRRFFEQLYDVPYPFDGFTIVERNDWGYGQAPPGLIFLTKEAFSSSQTFQEARWATQELNSRFIHEVAHAWWGHVAKMDSSEERWVTEGFAEYASGLGLRAMYGGKKGEKAFERMLDLWYGTGKGHLEGGSVYLASFQRADSRLDRDRSLLLYHRGAAVLHSIRLELRRLMGSDDAGDRAFTSFQRSVLKNFHFKWAHTRHMVTILGQISGTDWQPFFDRYVYGPEAPELPKG